MQTRIALVFVVAGCCLVLFPRHALAYLDPGTGSLIFQMVAAALVSIAAALRIYWRQIKAFFGRTNRNPSGDADGGGTNESGSD